MEQSTPMEISTAEPIQELPPRKQDKRRVTSAANLEKARQIKIDMLKRQRDIQKQANLALATQHIPVRKLESDESESSESEEDIIYVNPTKPSKPSKDIDELKKLVESLLAAKHESEKKQPVPIPEPIETKPIPIPEKKKEEYVYDDILGVMKRKILQW